MLRGVVLGFAILFVALAVAGVVTEAAHWPTLIVAVVILAGIVFERRRYGAAQAAPAGEDWQPTPERFFDETGQRVRVWFDAKSGARRYVADDSAPD